MHSKEIAQSIVTRNAIYLVTAGSNVIETVEELTRTAFACTNVFFL